MHHVKAQVSASEDIYRLRTICDEFGVHLSKSASSRARQSEPGELRFITARYRKVGEKTAVQLFDELVDRLQLEGFKLSNKLLEWTIYDSNLMFDKGWDGEIRAWADEPSCAYCSTEECPFEEEVA